MHQDERINAISHLVGAVLAVTGLVALLVLAVRAHSPARIVTFCTYGTTLVLLFLASTLYHSSHGKVRAVFRKLDHVAIYLLIAGTYTPVAILLLPPAWGWSLFGANWGLAVLGSLVEFSPWNRRRRLSYAIYVVMGWMGVVALKHFLAALPPGGLAWLASGGLFYTSGLVVLGWRTLPRRHEIWHFFVLGGSVCHYVVILLYVR